MLSQDGQLQIWQVTNILGLPEIPKCFIVTTIITATDLLFSPKMCKWEGKIEIVDKSIEDPGL